jgi:hypothetical protein
MRVITREFVVGLAVASVTVVVQADERDFDSDRYGRSFKRIATVPNYINNADRGAETVSEIVAVNADGDLLVYTDAETGSIGLVDIQNPTYPMPIGTIGLGGEPTSVDVLGNTHALVGVNTSPDLVNPTGHLAVIDLQTRATVAELDLGGQPDSLKISEDGRYVAVAIENERDEDIFINGVEGGLPQAPAGFLAIVDIVGGNPAAWTVRMADVSGLSTYGPTDPEPEFVDINDENEAVVSLQENNHLVIVDLPSGNVVGDFGAGVVDLEHIDILEEDIISLDGSLDDVPREPDAITWIEVDGQQLIGTANEGDLFGGSRGFSLFDRDGNVIFDSGNSFEHLAVRIGHYPEGRSENKGSEPESIEFGQFGNDAYVFVGSERGSFIGVYKVGEDGQPEFSQVLPGPLGPEGVLAIPDRNLLIVSGEEDDPTFGVRSTMMIYELKGGKPTYPQIQSGNDANGLPIPWSALSGMVGIPGSRTEMLAVWDSFYAESNIFHIDASQQPAVITSSTTIDGGTGNYDPEGIDVAPDGTYWIASEGNRSGSRPNRLLQVMPDGTLISEIGLPAEIEACRAAADFPTRGSGFEGIAVLEDSAGDYTLLIAQQRGWDYSTPGCEALDDDDGGLNDNGQPNRTRLWTYDPDTGVWGNIAWELAPLTENGSWIGLSEVTVGPRDTLVLIERDNRTGDWTGLKSLVRVSLDALEDGIVTADEKTVYDFIPAMLATNGWISDKPEGTAIMRDGQVFLVSDNDGVDDWSGETSFLNLGNVSGLFRR